MLVIGKKRPIFLNLLKIKLPVAGVMSIVHRASGAVMFLSTPILIYLFQQSLAGPEGFNHVIALFENSMIDLVLFLMMWALIHHLFAGIRYLLIDIEIGVDAPFYRQTAWGVLVLSPLVAAFLTWGLL